MSGSPCKAWLLSCLVKRSTGFSSGNGRSQVLPFLFCLCVWAMPASGFPAPRPSLSANFARKPLVTTLGPQRSHPLAKLSAINGPRSHPLATTKLSDKSMTVLDAAAVVGGSAVGGGFLAVPSIVAPLGLMPSTVGLLGVWVVFLLSAFAYVEAAGAMMSRGADDQGGRKGTSILSVSEHYFGNRVSAVLSLLFIIQMLAMLSANVVKAAEITSLLTRAPYSLVCTLVPAAAGLFVFGTNARLVQRVNTAFAGAMVAAFLSLFAIGLTALPTTTANLSFANWAGLLPRYGWVMPLFINTLRFGEAVPVVIDGLGQSRLRDARLAVMLGSLLPLLLAVIMSFSFTVLQGPLTGQAITGQAKDPVMAVLSSTPLVALLTTVIAASAIFSTLIGVFLASGQFIRDLLQRASGVASRRAMFTARAMLMGLPALIALSGPTLYLKLLSFSGAFPTSVLYGLLPPLAALALRWSTSKSKQDDAPISAQSRLVPGGAPMLYVLVVTVLTLLATNTALTLAPLWPFGFKRGL